MILRSHSSFDNNTPNTIKKIFTRSIFRYLRRPPLNARVVNTRNPKVMSDSLAGHLGLAQTVRNTAL